MTGHSTRLPVSVLLPVYNAEHTIDCALEDLIKQIGKEDQILVIDDGSTDQTTEIVKRTCRQTKSVQLIQRKRNSGIVAALNHGLSVATNPLIARADADDRFPTNRLDFQADRFANPDTMLVGTLMQTGRTVPEPYISWLNQLELSELMTERFVECTLAHPGWMFRRSLIQSIGGYRYGPFPEDYEFLLRLTDKYRLKNPLDLCKNTYTIWNKSKESLSQNDSRYSKEAFLAIRSIYLMKELRHRKIQGRRKLIIWGAGRKTRRRIEWLLRYGLTVHAWIDTDNRKKGNNYYNATVYDPEYLKTLSTRPFVIVALNFPDTRKQAYEYLESTGFQRSLDFLGYG